ncbi:hypothetical protein AZE42_09909 [Rhizopogon vesiculosus]|uniref:Uncharacterized protein n=1 Tax=Rhizopogon vesiculosus TaxID=180088 RepID=A0A1J8RB41_9AGAM|nr:hypothetical protein AZE42_09909 [Rhizopogon vesiculosus]
MSSNTAAIAAPADAATANQAFIALLDKLNEIVEKVQQSQSQEEKMRLSQTIAYALHDAFGSYRTMATYIPPRLLSMAAEVFRAQMGTQRLAQVPDWNRVGHNEDIW